MTQPSAAASDTASPRLGRRRIRRVIVAVGIAALLALIAVEVVARFSLGLGSPLLYVRDAEIEYLNKPNQNIRRFGNRVVINQYSQRNGDISPIKTDPAELRILLLGDSVVFGGTQLDQSLTVGSLLEQDLHRATGRPVRVLTIAAGSWGPPNVAAYLQRFGTFDADAALWVYPTDDWFDAMGSGAHVGRDPSFPDRKPWFATVELLTRYIWPRVQAKLHKTRPPPSATSSGGAADGSFQGEFLAQGLAQLKAAGIRTALIHWPNAAGLAGAFDHDAFERFAQIARDGGATFVDLAPQLRALDDTAPLYRDQVHPSAPGARWLTDRLLPLILSQTPSAEP